jgi:hypothetical protein
MSDSIDLRVDLIEVERQNVRLRDEIASYERIVALDANLIVQLREEIADLHNARAMAAMGYAKRILAMEDAIRAEIAWHEAEARRHRETQSELIDRWEDEAADEALLHKYDAIGHETAADRLRAIPEPEEF